MLFRSHASNPIVFFRYPILFHFIFRTIRSRHVFSATIISMACLHASLSVGVILLVLSALLGLVRILGGVHFPKDVVVGYICAIVWGVIFFLF